MNNDEVVPRYLVIADGKIFTIHESESEAIKMAETCGLCVDKEVVRSIRRWGLDYESAEMLEFGEMIMQPTGV